MPVNGITTAEVLDFITSIVASLAWPLAVLAILLVFRQVIVKLVGSLKERMPALERLTTPWGEVSWTSSAVEEVANEVNTSVPSRPADAKVEDGDIAMELVRLEPSAGVISAFADLERQILRYFSLSALPLTGSPVRLFLRDRHAPRRLKKVIRELSLLRNAAVHRHGDISEKSAAEYIITVRHVTNELTNLARDKESDL